MTPERMREVDILADAILRKLRAREEAMIEAERKKFEQKLRRQKAKVIA